MSIEKILAFAVGPVLILVILFFTIILPEKPPVKEVNVKTQQNVEENELYKKLKNESDKLKLQIQKKDTIIDSLSKLITSQETEFKIKNNKIEELTNKLSDKNEQTENAKELAKTFATMKTDEMAPILKNLDDETIILIYENMSNRVRKNYLLALSSQRAASLTKKIANVN